MSYLATFLTQHSSASDARAHADCEATKGTEVPFDPFVASPPPHAGLDSTAVPSDNQGLAIREVLAFPSRLLPELPLPTTLVLDVPTLGRKLTIAMQDGTRADLGAGEWLAMIASAEHGIAGPGMLRRLLARNGDIGGRQCSSSTPKLTVRQVLESFGATLRAIVIEGGEP